MSKSTLRAIIVDDEADAREQVRRHIEKIGGIEIISEAEDIQSATEDILYYKPDIVFLDIELHGENVFDLLKKLSKRKELTFTAVFVTAHYETYLEAALQSCGLVRKVAYLRKAIDHDKMKEVIEKVRTEISRERKGQLILTSGGEKIIIPYSDICYCSTDGPDNEQLSRNYIGIYTVSGEKIYVRESLSLLYAKLPATLFYKMSASYIINRFCVARIKQINEKLLCLLKCGEAEKSIVVPERQFQALKLEFPDS